MVYMMRDVANLEHAARRSLTNDRENVWIQSITPIAKGKSLFTGNKLNATGYRFVSSWASP